MNHEHKIRKGSQLGHVQAQLTLNFLVKIPETIDNRKITGKIMASDMDTAVSTRVVTNTSASLFSLPTPSRFPSVLDKTSAGLETGKIG